MNSSSSDKTECIICFDNLNDYSIAILSCGHKFHLHCIKAGKILKVNLVILLNYVAIVEIQM